MPPLAYLERQQALVDLGALQAGLPVCAGRVGAALVPRQVDEGELAVHLALPSQDDLEDGVATRRVGVGRRLPRRSGAGRERVEVREVRRGGLGRPGKGLITVPRSTQRNDQADASTQS